MTRSEKLAIATAIIVLVVLAFQAAYLIDEAAERDTARAQRACAAKLAVATTKADSLAVLTGDSWKVGCAWILAADTTR